jgi:hypothetical protein
MNSTELMTYAIAFGATYANSGARSTAMCNAQLAVDGLRAPLTDEERERLAARPEAIAMFEEVTGG